MEIVVNDTNILIDLAKADLVRKIELNIYFNRLIDSIDNGIIKPEPIKPIMFRLGEGAGCYRKFYQSEIKKLSHFYAVMIFFCNFAYPAMKYHFVVGSHMFDI